MPGTLALWAMSLSVTVPPGATVVSPSSPDVAPIWLKFAVTLFEQALVVVPALAELAGKTKTEAAAMASTASVA